MGAGLRLDFWPTLGWVAGMAIAAGGAVAALLSLPSRNGEARAWPPLRILRWDSSHVILSCRNTEWAVQLANKSGGEARAATFRTDRRFLLGSLVATLATALTVGALAWDQTHAEVRIDNASGAPMLIWLDGARMQVVEPNSKGADPPHVWIRSGVHQLGHSDPSASEPSRSVRVHVSNVRALYNPGLTACYWRSETVYAKQPTTAGGSERPLPRQEFYPLPDVDDWFRDSPEKIEVSDSSPVVRRVALQRNQACTMLAGYGCKEDVLRSLNGCLQAAQSREVFDQCIDTAAGGCGLTKKDGRK